MPKKQLTWLGYLLILLCVLVGGIACLTRSAEALPEKQENILLKSISNACSNLEFPEFVHEKEGYSDFDLWKSELKEKRDSFKGQASAIIEELSAHLTDEDQEKLKMYEENITTATNFATIQDNELLFNAIVNKARQAAQEAAIAAEQTSDYSVGAWEVSSAPASSSATTAYTPNNSGMLTKSGGVNYYNDRRETWYSSNVAYHYRTNEWTAGSDGVYRDADGYVVVAASDKAQGSTIDTSFGPGKVYDTGCPSGTTDIYVNW